MKNDTIEKLQSIIKEIDNNDDEWLANNGERMSPLGKRVMYFFWEQYDSLDKPKFNYPRKKDSRWVEQLEKTMKSDDYSILDKDDVLDIIFGLHHRNRVYEGIWDKMFKDGVMRKLMGRLLETEKASCKECVG
jgi:hypothetical protein